MRPPAPGVVSVPAAGTAGSRSITRAVRSQRGFGSFGVTTAVLEYRVAPYRHPAPKTDVERAIRIVRHRADELGVDPGRIGVMGFSAGGHLAATASTMFSNGDPDAADPVERLGSRPDFAVLCYPVISMTGPWAHRGSARNLLGPDASSETLREFSLQNRVSADTPPTFLFHTSADRAVPPENSVLYYQALREAGVDAELHIYRDGPHGIGLDRHPSIRSWPGLLREWLRHQGLLEPLAGGEPKWIWLGSEAGESQTVYFRRVFRAEGAIESALLRATCDNWLRAYVNGKLGPRQRPLGEPGRRQYHGRGPPRPQPHRRRSQERWRSGRPPPRDRARGGWNPERDPERRSLRGLRREAGRLEEPLLRARELGRGDGARGARRGRLGTGRRPQGPRRGHAPRRVARDADRAAPGPRRIRGRAPLLGAEVGAGLLGRSDRRSAGVASSPAISTADSTASRRRRRESRSTRTRSSASTSRSGARTVFSGPSTASTWSRTSRVTKGCTGSATPTAMTDSMRFGSYARSAVEESTAPTP